jgi:predicted metal-binding protein
MPEADLTIHVCTIPVCTVCRRVREDLAEGYDQPGLGLASALGERLAGKAGISVEAVECLAVCKRPCTVAFAANGKWTYLVGDLDAETHLDDIVGAAESYAASANGIIPWKERPIPFRKGVVARVPPLSLREPGLREQGSTS